MNASKLWQSQNFLRSPGYAFSCPSGLRSVLEKDLSNRWTGRIALLGGDESLLVCSAQVNPAEVVKLPFPSFLVISQKEFPPSASLPEIINSLINSKVLEAVHESITGITAHQRSFRFMVSKEGKLVAIDPQLRRKIENQIQMTLHLQHNPHKADNEFWVVIRREGLSFSGLRLFRPLCRNRRNCRQ
jgi:hypothetical protein